MCVIYVHAFKVFFQSSLLLKVRAGSDSVYTQIQIIVMSYNIVSYVYTKLLISYLSIYVQY